MTVTPPKKKRKREVESSDEESSDSDDPEENDVIELLRRLPEHFQLPRATMLTSKRFYYVIYRYDLATNLYYHAEVLPTPRLVIELKIQPLDSGEVRLTQAWRNEEVRMPRVAETSKFITVPIPQDALLGSSSVARFDHDTQYGRLFELVVPRFSEAKYTVGPPLRLLKQQDNAVTSSPLHQSPPDSSLASDGNSKL